MKRFDFTEELASYVFDNDIPDGEEMIIELDGRDICKAVVIRSIDDDIDFKVKAVR